MIVLKAQWVQRASLGHHHHHDKEEGQGLGDNDGDAVVVYKAHFYNHFNSDHRHIQQHRHIFLGGAQFWLCSLIYKSAANHPMVELQCTLTAQALHFYRTVLSFVGAKQFSVLLCSAISSGAMQFSLLCIAISISMQSAICWCLALFLI